MGGGARTKLKSISTPSHKIFRPLISTSLALALGVSVTNAEITITNDSGSNIVFNNSFTTSTSNGYDIFMNGANPIDNLMIWIGGNNNGFVTQKRPVEIQTNSSTIITSTNGISMNGGNGTLNLSTWSARNNNRALTLDLQSISSGNWAIEGSLSLQGTSPEIPDNTSMTSIILGGRGISRNLTIINGINNITFLDDAGIDGNLAIQYGANSLTFGNNGVVRGSTTITGGNNIFNPTNHAIFNGSVTIREGTTTILSTPTPISDTTTSDTPTSDITINNLFTNTIVLSGGDLIFAFADGVDDASKNFNFDTTKQIGSANQFSITGGTLTFSGAKSVFFNNGDMGNQGDGTLALNGGAVKFVINPNITQANQIDQAILKGSISATGAGVIFTLSDAIDKAGSNPFTDLNATPPTDTYYIDGDIAINAGGGLSVFWDDNKGFIGKIATTCNHTLIFDPISGLSGKNDVWFDSGTFTHGSNTISGIQATSGTSHLVFEDTITIGSGSGNVIQANGGDTMILFKNGATINGSITAQNNTNNIYFNGGSSTINGNLSALSSGREMAYNLISSTSNSSLTFEATTIEAGTQGDRALNVSINRLDLSGDTAFANTKIQALHTARDYARNHQNILKIDGNISGTISEVNSFMNIYGAQSGGRNDGHLMIYNAVSIQGTGALTIENINKHDLLSDDINSGNWSGNNYIAKEIISGSGENLTLNAPVFSNESWKSSDYQADIILTVTNDIFSNNGYNYINVRELNAGGIVADFKSSPYNLAGNYIVAGNSIEVSGSITSSNQAHNSFSIQGGRANFQSITASDGGNNTFELNGYESNFMGDLNATNNSFNQLFFHETTQSSINKIVGNIFTDDSSQTEITLEGAYTSLYLQGGSNTISRLNANGLENILYIDASNNSNYTKILNEVMGNELIVKFGGSLARSATLELNGSDNSLKTISLYSSDNSQNKLILTNNNTSISQEIFIGENQEMNFDMSSSNLYLYGGLRTNGRTNFNFIQGESSLIGDIASAPNINIQEGITNIQIGLDDSQESVSANLRDLVLSKNMGSLNVIFSGDFTSASTSSPSSNLFLNTRGNKLSSIVSNSSNAFFTLECVSSVVTDNISINSNKSLTFSFTGNGDSSITSLNGIVVGNGSTLGISIENYGDKSLFIGEDATIDLQEGSTLLVDFQTGANATATLGNSAGITIGVNRRSIINFHGGGGNATLTNRLVLNGGENTINFYGNATLRGIDLVSGMNTINVKAYENGGITGIITDLNSVENVSNVINLEKNATLQLSDTADGNLISTSSLLSSTLNFLGDNSRLLGGFGATQNGSAQINVGGNALISGNVSYANTTFTSSNSTLTLQGENNILTSLVGYTTTRNANNTLLLDSQSKQSSVNVSILNPISNGLVELKFGDGGVAKTLALLASGNTISNLTFGINSSNNNLSFTNGQNEITQTINIDNNNTLNISLADGVSLTLTQGANRNQGELSFFAEGRSILSGGDINANRLNFSDTQSSTLALKNSSGVFDVIDAHAQISTLSLDSTNGSVSVGTTSIIGDNLILNFNGANSGNATFTLNGNSNTLKAITLGNSTTNNTLILSQGNTNIAEAVSVGASQGITFDLANGIILTFSNYLSNLGGNVLFRLNNNSSSTIRGNITLGNNGVNTVTIGENGTLTLQGANNQLTTITSDGSGNNALSLDTTSNGVSAEVSNAIVGDNLTISMGGTTSRVTELTLNNTNGESTLKSLTLTENASAVGDNVLNLNANKTTIADNLTIDSDKGMTINLANSTELMSGITNSESVIINFNGTTSSKLTGNISTNGNSKTTIFNVANSGKGFINGNITLGNNGVNIATIEENGTLTLQGANNQLTSVTSTTSGILSLDGNGSTSGVEASVSSAITNSTTTLNFNGRANKKAEMTLSVGDNALKAITLGDDATDNKLILSTGNTSIQSATTIANNQALSFDLRDGINLTNNISNAGTTNLEFNGTNGTLTGEINTTAGTTTISIADNKSGTISGAISLSSGANNIATIGENGTLTLQGANNQLTSVTSTTSGILSLDGNGSTSGVEASVSSAITNSTTTLNFNGRANKKAEMTLSVGDNALKAITLGDDATDNKLILSTGNTSIQSATTIANNQALSFDLRDTTKLTFANNLQTQGSTDFLTQGNSTIDFQGANNNISILEIEDEANTIIQGKSLDINEIKMGKNKSITLILKNTQTSITSIQDNASSTLVLDATNNALETNIINSLLSPTTTIKMGGIKSNSATLNLVSENGNTIKALTLADNSTSNTLNIFGGTNTIYDQVEITDNQGLTLESKGVSKLVFENGFLTQGNGNSTLSINAQNQQAQLTLSGGNITLSRFIFGGSHNSKAMIQNAILNVDSLSSSDSGENMIVFDTPNIGSSVEIAVNKEVSGNSLNIEFNGNANQSSILHLKGISNTIKSILLGKEALSFENNIINLENGKTTILNQISLSDSTKGISFVLGDNTELSLIQGMQSIGKSNITISSNSSAIISGENEEVEIDTINLGNPQSKARSSNAYATLTLNNPTHTTIKNLIQLSDTNSLIIQSGEATINNSLSISQGKVSNFTFEGDDTSITFASNITNSGTLNFNFERSGTLVLQDITQANNKALLNINLGNDSTSSVVANIQSSEHISNININVYSNNSVLQYNDINGLVFSGGKNEITFMGDQAGLEWKQQDGKKVTSIQTTGGETSIYFNGEESEPTKDNYALLNAGLDNMGGSTQIIVGSSTEKSNSSSHAKIAGSISTSNDAQTKISFASGGNILFLGGTNNTISAIENYSDSTKNTISLANFDELEHGSVGDGTRGEYKTLLINGNSSAISGENLHFVVYVNPNSAQSYNKTIIYGDRIIIDTQAIDSNSRNHNLSVVFSKGTQLSELENLKKGISIATVKKISDSEDAITFNSEEKTIFGFNLATLNFNPVETNIDGQRGEGYTTYFLTKATNNGVIVAAQEITATAFTLNYDLYMANLNSLNKRMGELRENAHSQGVWARIFNGALSNEFGLGSKSNYTTIQAGYDYAFGFEGANNYLGVALSYALSTSTSQNAFDENGQRRGIDGIYSNAVEVALYNSYVSDRGWYNDNIAKFSYIMSKFDINNLNDNTSTSNDASNFAFTLSDEVGYVFKLGEAKEWSITPQIEATFGYFSQSDFKQTIQDTNDFLQSNADFVLTMRARVGSAFAYDFKNFTQKDSFNASLYVGTFYEYDYVSGGEITMNTNYSQNQKNTIKHLDSDGRVVMNVGTNMSIKDNTRLYFDFEKSFGGKITTDYQVNFGVRYSFGESNGYTPMIEKTESKAPLKIEDKEVKETKEEQADKATREDKVEQENKKEKEDKKIKEDKEIEKSKNKSQESKTRSNKKNENK